MRVSAPRSPKRIRERNGSEFQIAGKELSSWGLDIFRIWLDGSSKTLKHIVSYSCHVMKFPSVVLSAILLVLVQTSCTSESTPPNIVVFLIDDMGVMDTSVPFLTDKDGKPKRYPLNDYYRTPSMERLAKQGIRFNQFYAMSVCSPTRISIMTGQNAARHRATNWINPRSDNAGPNGPPEWNWAGLKKGDITLPGYSRGKWLQDHPCRQGALRAQ